MKRRHIALVALLITALATPIATAQAGPETGTPAANGTASETTRTTAAPSTATPTPTAGPVEQAKTAVENETEQTPIPTPPPDSQFADTPTPNRSEPERGERIEQGLVLLNASYEAGGEAAEGGERGTVTLTLRASERKAVTLVDAGAFSLGGDLPDRTLDPFEGTQTFEFSVYRPPGSESVGVTIVTDRTMYAEPIRVSPAGPDLPEFPTWGALLVGVSLTAVGTVAVDKYQSQKESQGVTRIEG